MPESFTNRGFAVYATVQDNYRQRVEVTESSRADEPAVWIFCDGSPGSPHLNREQAIVVRDALNEFIENGPMTDPRAPTDVIAEALRRMPGPPPPGADFRKVIGSKRSRRSRSSATAQFIVEALAEENLVIVNKEDQLSPGEARVVGAKVGAFFDTAPRFSAEREDELWLSASPKLRRLAHREGPDA